MDTTSPPPPHTAKTQSKKRKTSLTPGKAKKARR